MKYEPLKNKIFECFTCSQVEVDDIEEYIGYYNIGHLFEYFPFPIFYFEDVESAVNGLLSEIDNPEFEKLVKIWFSDIFLDHLSKKNGVCKIMEKKGIRNIDVEAVLTVLQDRIEKIEKIESIEPEVNHIDLIKSEIGHMKELIHNEKTADVKEYFSLH